ncbi:MAG: LytTR family DNA-binding domain-containing protein [Paracoccaceae bacterium]
MASVTMRQIMVSDTQMSNFIGSIFRNRTCIGLAISIWVFTSFLSPGDRFQDLSLFERALVNAGAAMVFYGCGYLFSARVQYSLMLRGIPFFWGAVAFYSVLAGGESLIYFALLPKGAGLSVAFSYWFTTVAMIMLTIALLVLFFDQPIRKNLSVAPADFPMWRPLQTSYSALELALPENSRGPVLQIEAENQYVRVTTANGASMLRMSLTDAEAMLPPGTGFRVHRSMWIHKSQICTVLFRDGNPKILCTDGQERPVGRSMVEIIKKHLSDV